MTIIYTELASKIFLFLRTVLRTQQNGTQRRLVYKRHEDVEFMFETFAYAVYIYQNTSQYNSLCIMVYAICFIFAASCNNNSLFCIYNK
jgi:hypothetical protein